VRVTGGINLGGVWLEVSMGCVPWGLDMGCVYHGVCTWCVFHRVCTWGVYHGVCTWGVYHGACTWGVTWSMSWGMYMGCVWHKVCTWGVFHGVCTWGVCTIWSVHGVCVPVDVRSANCLKNGCPAFSWPRATAVIASLFPGRTWHNNSKWCSWMPKHSWNF
jgi:hypothetical protein